jgi:alpha-1,6-mannosyltransferase
MFRPDRRDPGFRASLGIHPGQTVLLYAGRLSPEKELDVLFGAFAQLPPGKFVLVIAGDGPDVAAVRRYATANADAVRFLGHIASREALAKVYASSDIFVMPGRYETFGMSTLEALCSGLPVVGIRESGTATIVPPHAGVLSRAGDDKDLAAAIRAVAAWPAETTRAGCHAFAADQFSWDAVFDQYVEMYRELLREAAVPAALQPA